jgi:hypothetical protein
MVRANYIPGNITCAEALSKLKPLLITYFFVVYILHQLCVVLGYLKQLLHFCWIPLRGVTMELSDDEVMPDGVLPSRSDAIADRTQQESIDLLNFCHSCIIRFCTM